MNATLHELIAHLGELRTEKKRLEYDANQIGEIITQHEYKIMDMMDALEVTESKSAAGKVILSESVYPQVKDWDAFHQWIIENEYMHFLEKRAAVLAYREALGQGIAVPGVLPHTKRKLTFKET